MDQVARYIHQTILKLFNPFLFPQKSLDRIASSEKGKIPSRMPHEHILVGLYNNPIYQKFQGTQSLLFQECVRFNMLYGSNVHLHTIFEFSQSKLRRVK